MNVFQFTNRLSSTPRTFQQVFGRGPYYRRSLGYSVLLLTCLVLFTLLPQQLDAAQIRATLGDEPPKVADPFWVTIAISAEENANVVFPDVPTTLGPFEVLSHKDWFDVPVGNARSWTRHFQLESLQSGEFEIPSVLVSVDGETIATEPLTVSINSSVEANADPFKFRDFKKPIEITAEKPGANAWVLWAVSGLSIAAVLGFVCWSFYRKQSLTDSQFAMLQLEQLRNSEEYHRNDVRAISPKVADLLRSYIERRYSIAATKQTTDEFLKLAQQDDRLDVSKQATLGKFLHHIDEIKFAHLTPEEGSLDKSFSIAENFVRASSTEVQ